MTPARLGAALAAATTGLVAASLLTACSGNGGHPATAGEPAGHPSPSPTHVAQFLPPSSPVPVPTPARSRHPAATPLQAQPVSAGPPPCATGSMQLSVGPPNGTAGSIYYPLLLTNTAAVACTLYGYPGVALVTAPGGALVGPAAVRNPTFPKEVVTLAAGAIAHASLQVGIAANYPPSQCKPTIAHWLQVFPPGQYTALYAQFTAQTCLGRVGDGSILGIYVVRAGATGP